METTSLLSYLAVDNGYADCTMKFYSVLDSAHHPSEKMGEKLRVSRNPATLAAMWKPRTTASNGNKVELSAVPGSSFADAAIEFEEGDVSSEDQ